MAQDPTGAARRTLADLDATMPSWPYMCAHSIEHVHSRRASHRRRRMAHPFHVATGASHCRLRLVRMAALCAGAQGGPYAPPARERRTHHSACDFSEMARMMLACPARLSTMGCHLSSCEYKSCFFAGWPSPL